MNRPVIVTAVRSSVHLTLLVCLCAVNFARAAGPTSADPLLPLSLWSDREELTTLHNEATELCNQAYKSSQSIAERLEAGKIKQIKLLEIGKLYVLTLQLERKGRLLSMWGEPAGLDFQIRAGAIDSQMRKAMDVMKPMNAEALNKGRTALAGRYKKHKKNLEAVGKLIDQKKFAAAEAKLLPMYDDIQAMGVWYPSEAERADALAYFDQPMGNLDRLYTPVRQAKALEEIAAERAKRQPDFDTLLKAIAAATTSIATSGQAELDGQKLAGPQVFALLADRCQKVQADTLYCRSLDWATLKGAGEKSLAKLLADHESFVEALPAALAGLIAADAARASGANATPLLAQYCEVAAPVVLAADWPALTTAVSAALAKLEAKSAAAQNYRVVTDDLLRWRARAAETQARAARKDYGDVPKDAVAEPIYRSPLPDIARQTGEKLDGKTIKWTNLLASERGQPAASRYQSATFASATPVDLSAFEKQIDRDLFVTDKTPPLTLEASMARQSLRHGDLAEVGGSVGLVELDAIIPMFARPAAETAGLTRLGPLQPEVDQARDPQRQIRYRLEIVPDWARGKYGFVRISGK